MKTVKHTFFCQDLSSGILGEDEAHHASRVLRLKVGQHISLIDGKGTFGIGEIEDIHKKELSFKLITQNFKDKVLPEIHLAIAPTKSMDRFEFFLEKVTELGIDRITPLLCKNSERKNIKLERLEKIVMSATKQSGNYYLPQVDEMIDFKSFVSQVDKSTACFIAHCETDLEKHQFKNMLTNQKKVCILIGPEGDFNPEEITLAKENNFKPIGLGQTRLRTETAGIVACHTARLILST
ncbi:MAG: RsmE family RNA methyltransferase [Putridiphycobacter sp.]